MEIIELNKKNKKPWISTAIIWSIVVLVLLVSNAYFFNLYFIEKKENDGAKRVLKIQETNQKVLSFYRLFVEKVLRAKGEISFDTRLQLENSIRDINDPAILDQWNKFVASKSEGDAQQGVLDLLSVLLSKMS